MVQPSATALTENPPSELTAAEKKFIQDVVEKMDREEVLMRLKRDVQTACAIELATIPIYLYAYYSLYRNQTYGENLSEHVLFANKAGGYIMSVAVEEMLHMSLSSNIYYALTATPPALYGSSPAAFPTPLPYHKPYGPKGPEGWADALVSIPLARFSYEQLWHFLQIENPGHQDMTPKDRDWDTIGQFYSYIRCLIYSSKLTDADFQVGAATFQIQGYNYSPNNIDTVNPTQKFDPWATPTQANSAARNAYFANSADSHAGPAQLITVASKNQALLAIDTICDQGEGFSHKKYDDMSHTEYSHYYKFLLLQAQMEPYLHRKEELNTPPQPPEPVAPTIKESDLNGCGLLFDFPDNPKVSEYPQELRPIAQFCNGLYQYMLIMTETIYHVAANPNLPTETQAQKYYFNIALHRSMIWVLDKFIQTMRGITIASGAHSGKIFAPTFEFVDLGRAADSFSALNKLGQAAITAAQNAPEGIIPGYSARSIIGYVNAALTETEGGKSMHLPNVADYL